MDTRTLRVALAACALALALPAAANAGAAPGFEAPEGCKNPALAGLASAGFPRVLPLTYLCPFEPRTDCLEASAPGAAKLLLKQVNEDRTRDRVRWRIARGQASAPADLGDPTVDTDYELCVYVESGGACNLVVHPDALAGAGWRKRANGFEFVAPAGGNPNGIRRIRLRTGADGRSQVLIRGKGDLLGLEALPLPADAAILVQLHNGADRCWSTEFGQTPLEQTERRFKDRND
jgi:hypothetical protein